MWLPQKLRFTNYDSGLWIKADHEFIRKSLIVRYTFWYNFFRRLWFQKAGHRFSDTLNKLENLSNKCPLVFHHHIVVGDFQHFRPIWWCWRRGARESSPLHHPLVMWITCESIGAREKFVLFWRWRYILLSRPRVMSTIKYWAQKWDRKKEKMLMPKNSRETLTATYTKLQECYKYQLTMFSIQLLYWTT